MQYLPKRTLCSLSRLTRPLALLLLVQVGLSANAFARSYSSTARSCGSPTANTVYVRTEDQECVNVRLAGIDCPEKAWEGRRPVQPSSGEAKAFAEHMVLNKIVSVRLKDDETYGRAVGEIFVDGRSLNRELVRAGLL